ncbi:MAG TPA: hypothetical protein VGL42_02495 [Opitutaceae bacterium]|jgi:hypothetical protein
MKSHLGLAAGIVAGLLALGLTGASAQVATYANVSDYAAAASLGGYSTQDRTFDSDLSGTVIPSGGSADGIVFTYPPGDFGGFSLQVDSGFDTTSGVNYLGTTGDGSFLSGDSFTMTFSHPVEGVGLFVISGGNNIDGDYSLGVAQGTALSSGMTDSTFGTLPDGGNVYFVGLIESNPADSFTTATFSSVDGGFGIPFNVDDISMLQPAGARGVPDQASSVALLAAVLILLMAVRTPCFYRG